MTPDTPTLLRQAAARLREVAKAATPGPWRRTQDHLTHPRGFEIEGPDGEDVVGECCGYTGSIANPADAILIETMADPRMAVALADWLDVEATEAFVADGIAVVSAPALAIARLVLGGEG